VDWYGSAFLKMVNGEIDLDDGMIFTLHSNAYALNRFTNAYVSDLTNELATGGGYTSGGIAAGVVSRTLTQANSWAVQRANSTAYTVGDVVRPAAGNGFLYRATTTGTSGGSIPAFPTNIGDTVADGTTVWECYARAIIVFTAANAATWATATFTARYLVLSDRTNGLAAQQPLVGVRDFGSDQTGGGGNFTVNPHASLGLLHIAIP
jgi:hypothetical protein